MPAGTGHQPMRLSDPGRDAFSKSPVSTHRSALIIKSILNDQAQCHRSSGSAVEDLFSRRGKMPPGPKAKDVLNRLDSLVAGGVQDVSPLEYNGILKPKTCQLQTGCKKKNIRFADKQMQEIIGWDGGKENYGTSSSDSSDEERERTNISKVTKNEELTAEERNVINLTRKNTSYNAHAPNLLQDVPPEKHPTLAFDKVTADKNKLSPPLITVRPFTNNHSPGKVNKVHPMINGEVVKSVKDPKPKSEELMHYNIDSLTSRQVNKVCSDKLNSDGSSENPSSPSGSDGESSISSVKNSCIAFCAAFDASVIVNSSAFCNRV